MELSDRAREALSSARAFWAVAPGEGELRRVDVPAPAEGDVLVETALSAVSRGTEALVFRGGVPPSEYQRMRCPHQDGAFPFPVKYGYSAVGEVVAGLGVGRRVFCLHPHQSAFCVPASAVVEVPDDVPTGRAVLAANLETAINGTWDGQLSIGDRVVIVGAGVVGCLLAALAARTPGCHVQLVDTDPRKAKIAAHLGVAFGEPGETWSGADLVFHASASGAGLQHAIDAAGCEATIIEMSWYGKDAVSVGLGAGFHAGRLSVRSSQVGTIPPHQRARWDYRRRLTLAMRLLGDPTFDHLLTGESAFDELPQTMAELGDTKDLVLCHRIRYA